MTPEEIALDIYKTISVSLRNDAYAEYQQAQFVEQITPIIRATVAAERAVAWADAERLAEYAYHRNTCRLTLTGRSCNCGLETALAAHAEAIRARAQTERTA